MRTVNNWLTCLSTTDWRFCLPEYCVFYKPWALFCQHVFTWIPTWISNHMASKALDEISYSFSNFNGFAVEVWEWISNFIIYFIMGMTAYPCRVIKNLFGMLLLNICMDYEQMAILPTLLKRSLQKLTHACWRSMCKVRRDLIENTGISANETFDEFYYKWKAINKTGPWHMYILV